MVQEDDAWISLVRSREVTLPDAAVRGRLSGGAVAAWQGGDGGGRLIRSQGTRKAG